MGLSGQEYQDKALFCLIGHILGQETTDLSLTLCFSSQMGGGHSSFSEHTNAKLGTVHSA